MAKQILLFTLLFFSFNNYASIQAFYMEFESYDYRIDNLDSYTSEAFIKGRNLSDSELPFTIAYDELASLQFIELYVIKGSKRKKINIDKNILVSTISHSSFFSGVKKHTIEIPAFSEFELKYKLKENHSIFLSKMFNKGFYRSDSVMYGFHLPENLTLTTSDNSHYKRGVFFTTSEHFTKDSVLSFLIHPIDKSPADYFSQWFETKIAEQMKIDPLLIPDHLKEIAKTGNKKELALKCFEFVQQEIKYIDVENGINAIVPRNSEKVIRNKIGDCKDMALLLTSLYRYFDLESYLSISRTNDMEGKFDFPSVGSANHMICSLLLDDEWYYLDPTEKSCLFGDPSTQIFGTEAFLIGFSENYFQNIPSEPRSSSRAVLQYIITDKYIILELFASGKMNQTFYYSQNEMQESKEFIEKILGVITDRTWVIDSLNIKDSSSFLTASCGLNSTLLSVVGKKKMLNMIFIPDVTNLVELFYNAEYPLFNSTIEILVLANGKIQNKPDSGLYKELEIEVDENGAMKTLLNLKISSAEEFEKHNIHDQWKKLWSKPLIISNE